jgi:hypothetical protein
VNAPLSKRELAARESALAAVTALRSRELPLIEGARRLANLRHEISGAEDDPDLLFFAAIDSEVDHIPPPAARALCAPSWLASCDAEVRAMEVAYGQQALDACARLITRFSRVA